MAGERKQDPAFCSTESSDELKRHACTLDAESNPTYYTCNGPGNVSASGAVLRRGVLGQARAHSRPYGLGPQAIWDAEINTRQPGTGNPERGTSSPPPHLHTRTRVLLRERSRLAETTYLGYDQNGNQTAVTAPGGEVAYYAYDPLDRLSAHRADAFDTDRRHFRFPISDCRLSAGGGAAPLVSS